MIDQWWPDDNEEVTSTPEQPWPDDAPFEELNPWGSLDSNPFSDLAEMMKHFPEAFKNWNSGYHKSEYHYPVQANKEYFFHHDGDHVHFSEKKPLDPSDYRVTRSGRIVPIIKKNHGPDKGQFRNRGR